MMLKLTLVALLAVGVLGEYLTMDNENVELYANFMKEQCKKNGAEDKYEQAKNASLEYEKCINNYLNVDQVKAEVAAAKTQSALSEVIKKYCEKSSEIITCTDVLFEGMSPCVDPHARYQVARNATNRFIEFICENGGERMTAFITQGGPDCFRSKLEDVRQCVANRIGTSFSDTKEAEKMTVADKCLKYDSMAICIVGRVRGCNPPDLGDMAEDMVKFIRRETPCHTALPLLVP